MRQHDFIIMPQVGELSWWCCLYCQHRDPDFDVNGPNELTYQERGKHCKHLRRSGEKIIHMYVADNIIRCKKFKVFESDEIQDVSNLENV
jgi:hypothetical protein